MTRSLRLFLAVSALSVVACGHDTLCPSDEALCDGRCTTLGSDPRNCGACGNVCSGRDTCSAGQCQLGTSAADLYLGCFDTNEVRTATRDLALVGAPVDLTAGPVGLAWAGGALFVAAAGNGGAETIDRITGDLASLHADAVWTGSVPIPDIEFLAEHRGYLYVSHTSTKSLLVLSPSGEKIDEHFFASGTEPNPNPLGIAFDGDHALVALQAANAVAVLDVSSVGTSCTAPGGCIRELARVDVSGLASTGANSWPARIAVVGRRAFVTLWNLDANYAAPAGSTGRVAVIDLDTDALDATVSSGGVAGLIELGTTCLDPADLAVQGSTIYVTCGAFDFPAIVAQGIGRIDLSGATPVVQGILPAPSDSAPGKLAFCSGSGYLGDRNSGRVFRLDPVAGAVDGVELCPAGSGGYAYVADIACGF